jgi:hypothetical protein
LFRGLARASSARSRALVALPVVALALAGCSATGGSTSTVTAQGATLRLYLSDPPAVQKDPALQSIVYGEELAWSQHKSMAGVSVEVGQPGTASVSQNARNAIHDNSVIAYIGEIQTGQSVQSVGITNAEDILEFSPTDDVRPVKNDFESFSSYGRTFASLPLQLTTSTAALNRAAPSNFAASYKADFPTAPAPSAQAITGYDAVWVVLRVLKALGGQAANRGRVAASVIATLEANKGQASVADFKIKLK